MKGDFSTYIIKDFCTYNIVLTKVVLNKNKEQTSRDMCDKRLYIITMLILMHTESCVDYIGRFFNFLGIVQVYLVKQKLGK